MPLMRPRPGPGPLAAFLEHSPHAYARHELTGAWSRRQLDAALRSGSATRLLTGVYCGTTHAGSQMVRAEALVLWQPAAALTGTAALHLYAPHLPAPGRSDFVVPLGHRVSAPPWARAHQTAPRRGFVLAQGVRCVEMPRALLDAWRFAPPRDRRTLLWEALWAKVCTWRQLARELERAPRVAGRRDLERVLAWFAEGATSPLEVRAKHETFADARFREFEWQAPLSLSTRRVRPDLLHRRAMVAIELDGDRYHSTREARDADRERRTDLTAAGYAVLGFGWRDIVDRPAWCRERVLTTVAGRIQHPART